MQVSVVRSAFRAGPSSFIIGRSPQSRSLGQPLQFRLCTGSAPQWGTKDDNARISVEQDAQRQLMRASTSSMSLKYNRCFTRNWFTKVFRAFAIDTNYDFKKWHRHQKFTRHLALWTPRNFFRADNLRRLIFPDLLLVGASSSILCYVSQYQAIVTLPLECFTITSMALGLLVTFKTQRAYERFIEGRSLWGQYVNETRALTSRILNRVPSHNGRRTAEVTNAVEHAVKLIRTFPLTVKYHLTADGCNPHINVHSGVPDSDAVVLALRAELQKIWDIGDPQERAYAQRILSADLPNRPVTVLNELSHINAHVFSHPVKGALDDVAASEMDRSLTTLHHALGACEKILRTPIYTPYTKFTSRFLYCWCHGLPFALFPLCGPVGTVPASLTITFFMLGIEDIGSRVEQPFDVMPLWQYCQVIDQSCVQMVKHNEILINADKLDATDKEALAEEFFNVDLKSWSDPLQ